MSQTGDVTGSGEMLGIATARRMRTRRLRKMERRLRRQAHRGELPTPEGTTEWLIVRNALRARGEHVPEMW